MKNKYHPIVFIVILSTIITSCSVLPNSRPATDAAMQTEIVQILTAMVTETSAPIIEATPTQQLFPATDLPLEQPTEEPIIEQTNSEIGQLATSTPGEAVFLSTPAPLPEEGSPPATLEPIPTSKVQQSTQEPSVTPTQPADDPALTLGAPTWKDTFDNGNNWPLGLDTYVDLKAGNGTLQMTGLTSKNGWRLSGQKAANFYLELTGKMSTCSGADQFGIIFRVPNLSLADRGYLYGISCDGKYALRKWNIDTMTVLANWQEDDSIRTGSNQTNRIGVMVKGSELKLFVNGVLVDSIKDTTFNQGHIGLYIGPKETTRLTAVLDEIAYWILP